MSRCGKPSALFGLPAVCPHPFLLAKDKSKHREQKGSRNRWRLQKKYSYQEQRWLWICSHKCTGIISPQSLSARHSQWWHFWFWLLLPSSGSCRWWDEPLPGSAPHRQKGEKMSVQISVWIKGEYHPQSFVDNWRGCHSRGVRTLRWSSALPWPCGMWKGQSCSWFYCSTAAIVGDPGRGWGYIEGDRRGGWGWWRLWDYDGQLWSCSSCIFDTTE